jgi:hypothetical protein
MKSDRRKKEMATARAKKAAAMSTPGGVSQYGKKRAEQRRGVYRPTSPFYVREGS